MDALGDHALCCHPLGIYNRHNELRNEFSLLCKDLGLQVELEKGPEGALGCLIMLYSRPAGMGGKTICFLLTGVGGGGTPYPIEYVAELRG